MLGGALFGALSEDASFYTVADYRLEHGGLPLGWLALLAQPGWAPAVMMFGLVVLLPPRRQAAVAAVEVAGRTRGYVAVGLLWIVGAVFFTVRAIAGHHPQVDSSETCSCLRQRSRCGLVPTSCNRCSSWCWRPAGSPRWPVRCSATGARPANAASSSKW